MDWLRLFVLLIAVASVHTKAEGPKKKIRIHLPQKVKHIHHHKKIYITNHPAAASQYAPAYLPSGEGPVAVPSNMGLPAVAGILPVNSMELYEDTPPRYPGGVAAASKLLPLYRARGYYGPTPSQIDEDEYDLAPPPEPIEESYQTNDYAPPPPPPSKPRIKIIKVKEPPRKKANKKQKPKRAPVRSRPPRLEPEEEHPVSNFHEQFYSDVDGTTIRKIKKPPRVEKIVDGDTEHIHTYSEEHIHKLVFGEDSKLPGLVGVNPLSGMSALSAVRPLIPIHNQPLLAIPPDALTGFAAVASPSHLNYAAYNPRDVTHDHIFHDHGEISSDVDLSNEALALPPKISYNSQGLRISGSHPKRLKSKYLNKYPSPTKPTPTADFSYYESIYTPSSGLKKVQRPKISNYGSVPEANLDDYRPIPSFKVSGKHKPRSYGENAVSEFRQTSAPSAFGVSSTIVHDYQPKAFPGAPSPTGFSKFEDSFTNFEDNYANNFEYDTFASSSNMHTSDHLSHPGTKAKKKSISTQNINFGGKDHQTSIDHLGETGMAAEINDDDTPSALENFSSYDDTRPANSVTSTPYTIKESSPVHQYYTAMAVKAMQNEPEPEASNNNFQYIEAPKSTSPSPQSIATTNNATPQYLEMSNQKSESTGPEYQSDKRQQGKSSSTLNSEQDPRQRYSVLMDYKGDDRPNLRQQAHHHTKYMQNPTSGGNVRGLPKYGDKI